MGFFATFSAWLDGILSSYIGQNTTRFGYSPGASRGIGAVRARAAEVRSRTRHPNFGRPRYNRHGRGPVGAAGMEGNVSPVEISNCSGASRRTSRRSTRCSQQASAEPSPPAFVMRSGKVMSPLGGGEPSSPVLPEPGNSANIRRCSGFIWRIPAYKIPITAPLRPLNPYTTSDT